MLQRLEGREFLPRMRGEENDASSYKKLLRNVKDFGRTHLSYATINTIIQQIREKDLQKDLGVMVQMVP